MRTYPFALAAVLALAFAYPTHSAEKPRTAQAGQAKKVWSNDDMDQLRSRGLISTFTPAPETAAQAQAAISALTTYTTRFEDPGWYALQAADIQAELDKRVAALREAQAGIAQATAGITQHGIDMDAKNVGITPEAGVAILEAQVREVQNQLDELSDLARQNNIPPGALRG
jgi:L-lactate utilization protein LutC